jgi:hypothetical protein
VERLFSSVGSSFDKKRQNKQEQAIRSLNAAQRSALVLNNSER